MGEGCRGLDTPNKLETRLKSGNVVPHIFPPLQPQGPPMRGRPAPGYELAVRRALRELLQIDQAKAQSFVGLIGGPCIVIYYNYRIV